jgi:hypothetical protein
MMCNEHMQLLFQKLFDDDGITRGRAIRELAPLQERLLPVLPRLFELTFDALTPIGSDSEAVIRRMGAAAVPFLLEKARSREPAKRERALSLLMTAGGRRTSTTLLSTQVLEPRTESLPDWGGHGQDVWEAFAEAVLDLDLSVRFVAASAFEEFEHSGACQPV